MGECNYLCWIPRVAPVVEKATAWVDKVDPNELCGWFLWLVVVLAIEFFIMFIIILWVLGAGKEEAEEKSSESTAVEQVVVPVVPPQEKEKEPSSESEMVIDAPNATKQSRIIEQVVVPVLPPEEKEPSVEIPAAVPAPIVAAPVESSEENKVMAAPAPAAVKTPSRKSSDGSIDVGLGAAALVGAAAVAAAVVVADKSESSEEKKKVAAAPATAQVEEQVVGQQEVVQQEVIQQEVIQQEVIQQEVIVQDTIIKEEAAVIAGGAAVAAAAAAVVLKNKSDIRFANGWGGYATLASLHEAGCISDEDTQALIEGKIAEDDPAILKKLYIWLYGKSPIAGILLEDGTKMTLYEASQRGIITPGTSTSLLEAQAATGAILDPMYPTYSLDPNTQRYNVKQAASRGLIERGMAPILKRSENAVQGYINKLNPTVTRKTARRNQVKEKMSIFQAMDAGLVVEQHGIRCLEAQLATGGIVDVNRGHRLPLDFAYAQGIFDAEMHQALVDPSDDTLGFTNPNTDQNMSYDQMMKECTWDDNLQLLLFPYKLEVGQADPTTDVLIQRTGGAAPVTFQDAINAGLISGAMLTRYRTGRLSTSERETIKQKITSSLEGFNPIAGIYEVDGDKYLSIDQALEDGLIHKTFAIDLLEAQAACGRMIDVKNNRIVPFATAESTHLFPDTLLSEVEDASKAFYGFTSPYSDDNLSTLQAIDSKLINNKKAIKFLDAQLATGGLIDKRVPLRQTLDSAVSQKLTTDEFVSDFKSDTYKFRYVDPISGTACNYSSLLSKCKISPTSGFNFFPIQASRRINDEGKIAEIRKVIRSREASSISGNAIKSYKSTRQSQSDNNIVLRTNEKIVNPGVVLSRENSNVTVSTAKIKIGKDGRLVQDEDFKFEGKRSVSDLTSAMTSSNRQRILSSGSNDGAEASGASGSGAVSGSVSKQTSRGGTTLNAVHEDRSRTKSTLTSDGKRRRRKHVTNKRKRKAVMITNPKTGEQMTLEEAHAAGLINDNTYQALKAKVMNHDSDSAASSVANSRLGSRAGSSSNLNQQ